MNTKQLINQYMINKQNYYNIIKAYKQNHPLKQTNILRLLKIYKLVIYYLVYLKKSIHYHDHFFIYNYYINIQ